MPEPIHCIKILGDYDIDNRITIDNMVGYGNRNENNNCICTWNNNEDDDGGFNINGNGDSGVNDDCGVAVEKIHEFSLQPAIQLPRPYYPQ